MSLTGALRPFFHLRTSQPVKAEQTSVLQWLLSHGTGTRFAQDHNLASVRDYSGLLKALPEPVEYEQIRPYVMRMLAGDRDILWPGRVRNFAQSSGTSGGKSKYIPVTDISLKLNHYAGGKESVRRYLSFYPQSCLFDGKAFILGGSFATEATPAPGIKVGDVSATLIDRVNPLVSYLRVPDKSIALMPQWTQKLPLLVEAASRCRNITNLSGVPSWMSVVLQQILLHTGKSSLKDVWPRLEVFFHGGIAFGPYRQQYAQLCGPEMRYFETYNASEGFFAVQNSLDNPAMKLLTNHGVFYEFENLAQTQVLPSWEVEVGQDYGLIISSCNGLWRYRLGDVVQIVDRDPLTIVITGRTRCFINAFGEEVMVHNTDRALEATCNQLNCQVADYTAAPVYASTGKRGHHQWFIEFSRQPGNLSEFADLLDKQLCHVNSDYEAKRSGNIFLDPLEVISMPHGTFDSYLAHTGKLGGQRKVPRLCNDRHIAEALLDLLKEK